MGVIFIKRLLIIFMAALLLAACGNDDSGVKDGKFTFDTDDFIQAYEEHSGKLMPGEIEVDEESMNVNNVNKEELIQVMEVMQDLTEDDKMSNVINTFREKEDVGGSSEKMTVVITGSDDDYSGIFILKIDDSTK